MPAGSSGSCTRSRSPARSTRRAAASELREALSLWRGEALVEFSDASWAIGEIARLAGLQLWAIEARIDADLALGRHGALLPELESLVDVYPLRERFWGQLMLALYRSGRQAEALRAYRRLHTLLDDELGIRPSTDLVNLERAMLLQEPGLDLPPAPQVAIPGETGGAGDDTVTSATGRRRVNRASHRARVRARHPVRRPQRRDRPLRARRPHPLSRRF